MTGELSCVFFDAGFTLLEPWPSVGFHYAGMAKAFGAEAREERLNAAFRPAWKSVYAKYQALTPVPYGRDLSEALVLWTEVVRETFRLADCEAPGDSAYYRAVFDRFATRQAWRLYDDIEPALGRLAKARVRVGILSNWDARLRPILRDFGIDGRFDPIVLSCEVGAEKPAAAIFEAAARAVGLPPGRIALIGDEPEADGFGPLSAGWRQCLVRRDARPVPDGLDARPTLPAAVDWLLGG